uniref:PDZ domain-containing protein n=1 Tax=Corethron hystrix TaxID=216773 RepID=A0A7S1FVB1_9STRA|mmetsp:Transcript_3230/g.5954  ORF Transcript_3230/g.5954 Transcript_3230/m.5954 type:complete len:221 (+) Transcript_3230:188-850(+)
MRRLLQGDLTLLFIAITSCLQTATGFHNIVSYPFGVLNRYSGSLCTRLHSFSSSGVWNMGNAFGKGQFRFYESFDQWMAPLSADKEEFPELFSLPDGVYETNLEKPLGIIFEEIEAGKGVYVKELVEGGNADRQGIILPGHELVAITAVKIVGAKWERRMIPALNFDFDTVVGAIMSNDQKWGCNDVVLQFRKPEVYDEDRLMTHLDFFEPPFNSPWKIS